MSAPELLDPAAILALAEGAVIHDEPITRTEYRYLKSFGDAADGLIEYAANPHGRIMLGMHDLDVMTRGMGPGELIYVTGRSHSGKTQVVLNAIANNRDRNIIVFSHDEVAELVLSKLIAITHGVDAETLEARIKAGDQQAIDLVRRVANDDFKNLIVLDESLTFGQMADALAEARHYWGAPEDLVVVDYLEIVPGGDDSGDGVVGLSKAMKRWSKPLPCPTICLRQNSRGSGKRGQAAGISGMQYGGENEAIMILEVYRKLEDPELDPHERKRHQKTVTVNLAKNKRPPARKGECDLYMDPETGVVRILRDGDLNVGVPLNDTQQMMEARRAAMQQSQRGTYVTAEDQIPGQLSVDPVTGEIEAAF